MTERERRSDGGTFLLRRSKPSVSIETNQCLLPRTLCINPSENSMEFAPVTPASLALWIQLLRKSCECNTMTSLSARAEVGTKISLFHAPR